MSDYLKNVAIVGASGSVGKPTVEALLKGGKHNITVITRKDSSATFPEGVTVKRGDYDDTAFMQSALQGRDVLIIMLAFAGLCHQDRILEEAAKAGVKYVLPSEYGMDSSVKRVHEMMPMMQKKLNDQRKIQDLGMRFIAVITSLWTDYLIEHRLAGIDIVDKKATIYTDSNPWHTTTTTQVGRGIAAMLALPISVIDKEFANGSLYLSSFQPTHEELFQAVLEATEGKETDWSIGRKSKETLFKNGSSKIKAGDHSGHWDLLYYATLTSGLGADYVKSPHNEMLGLPKESLVDTIRQAAKHVQSQPGNRLTTVSA